MSGDSLPPHFFSVRSGMFRQVTRFMLLLARLSAGRRRLAKIPRIATTTNSSRTVKLWNVLVFGRTMFQTT
jgi:hypothetical protein